MANKKKTTAPEQVEETAQDVIEGLDPKQLEEARQNMREQLRERFGEWLEIADETATDDDITKARDEFQAEVTKYTEQDYTMADAEEALEMVEFIRNWNAKYNYWEKGAWRGVVQLDRVLGEKAAALRENPGTFDVDYQTLMFLYKSMQNPSGYGLESALQMVELEAYDVETGKVKEGHEHDMTYSKVVAAVFKNTNYLQLVDKMLKIRQERINLAAAGIKFDFKCTELEEFAALHDAWVASARG